MILSDAITKVRQIIKEPTAALWSKVEITDWLNEGNQDFHSWKGIQDIWTTSVDGETEIGLDTGMVRLFRLTFIADGETDETLINSDTYDIFKDRVVFDEELEDGTLTWYGERLPTAVEDDDDAFEIDVPFESALIDYACFRAFEKDESPMMSFALSNYLSKKALWEKKRLDKYAGDKTTCQKTW